MPRAFGFDGDSAYYESLEAKIRADEKAKADAQEAASRERRRSLGLPEEEHVSRKDRKAMKDPERKKSVGEKIANFVFNAGRPGKLETKQVDRVGRSDGGVVKRSSSSSE